MPITYVEGDATDPRKKGENDCPCLLTQQTQCGQKICYHFSGEGACSACLFSSGLTAESMTVKQLLWYLGQMFGVEIRPKTPTRPKRPEMFRKKKR